jgi:hypothetical protein
VAERFLQTGLLICFGFPRAPFFALEAVFPG